MLNGIQDRVVNVIEAIFDQIDLQEGTEFLLKSFANYSKYTN